MKSPKQTSLENSIRRRASGKALDALGLLFDDPEVQHLQDYANTVSIRRLHYNDHGPVHMRKVVLNALIIIELLHQAEIPLSLEKEEQGTWEDSRVALVIASLLHDVGMSVGRANHEAMGVMVSLPLIERTLLALYPEDAMRRVILRSLVVECMVGHMGTQRIHSLEAGVILVADGCDMEQGRARIPLSMETVSKVGDIHKYSSHAVKRVTIEKGERKPVRITVSMSESVGFFQVEEVLLRKIDASPIKPWIELHAGIVDRDVKIYL